MIARVPAGESVVRPRSRCPRCGAPIAARDNVPVVSWLLLRGRARCCGAPISARYPAVELVTAAAFAVVAAWCDGRVRAPAGRRGHRRGRRPAPSCPHAWGGSLWPLPAFQFLAAVSVALVAIDLEHLRLPFWLVVPSWWVGGALLGGAALLLGRPDAAVRMLLGGLAYWGLYRLLYAVQPRPARVRRRAARRAARRLYLAWVSWGTLVLGRLPGHLRRRHRVRGAAARAPGRVKTELPYGPARCSSEPGSACSGASSSPTPTLPGGSFARLRPAGRLRRCSGRGRRPRGVRSAVAARRLK